LEDFKTFNYEKAAELLPVSLFLHLNRFSTSFFQHDYLLIFIDIEKLSITSPRVGGEGGGIRRCLSGARGLSVYRSLPGCYFWGSPPSIFLSINGYKTHYSSSYLEYCVFFKIVCVFFFVASSQKRVRIVVLKSRIVVLESCKYGNV